MATKGKMPRSGYFVPQGNPTLADLAGGVGAGVRSFGNEMTFGALPYIAGAPVYAAGKMNGIPGSYMDAVDAGKGVLASDEASYPAATGLGTLASMMSPMGSGKKAAKKAATEFEKEMEKIGAENIGEGLWKWASPKGGGGSFYRNSGIAGRPSESVGQWGTTLKSYHDDQWHKVGTPVMWSDDAAGMAGADHYVKAIENEGYKPVYELVDGGMKITAVKK